MLDPNVYELIVSIMEAYEKSPDAAAKYLKNIRKKISKTIDMEMALHFMNLHTHHALAHNHPDKFVSLLDVYGYKFLNNVYNNRKQISTQHESHRETTYVNQLSKPIIEKRPYKLSEKNNV